jgi:hypothetical protein
MIDKEKFIQENLIALCSLEAEIQQNFNDKDLINEINTFKDSINFFILENNLDRAIYDSNHLVSYLIDVTNSWK